MAEWQAWGDFAAADAGLAAFVRERLAGTVAYLATVRDARLPRVHLIQPIISERRLLVFMLPSSPKAHDLRADGRYALHSAVADTEGSNGEFSVRGQARLTTDPDVRHEAAAAGYAPRDAYILFELGVEHALATTYEDGAPQHRRWPPA